MVEITQNVVLLELKLSVQKPKLKKRIIKQSEV